jgi:predicted Zn-dependent protease
MFCFNLQERWAELSAQIDRALHLNPTNITVLVVAANTLVFAGHPEKAVAMADLALRLDPQMPPGKRSFVIGPYFFGRKFERAIEQIKLMPDEDQLVFYRFQLAASYAFLGRTEDAERAKADLIAKNGAPVLEQFHNEGEVFARTQEEDVYRDGFRELGFRICATDEELKKYENPKRLPECVKT